MLDPAPEEAAMEVARSLIVGLRAQVPAEGFTLAGIEVQLGELVDLVPGDLAGALSLLLPDIDVQIKVMPAMLRCLDCGAEYPADEHPCPTCGSANAELFQGNELQISRAWGVADSAQAPG